MLEEIDRSNAPINCMPLTGLGRAIARRLQQIWPSFRPQHRGLDNSNKMIEKVKACAFSEQVKDDLARSSGAVTSLSLRTPWKTMRFLYSTTSTAELLRPLEMSRKMSRKPFLMFCHQKPQFCWRLTWFSKSCRIFYYFPLLAHLHLNLGHRKSLCG